MPLILPAVGDQVDSDALFALADGILLTGSSSNVHPHYFDQTVRDPRLPLDAVRDTTTLPLILSALRHGVPLLADEMVALIRFCLDETLVDLKGRSGWF